MKHMAHLQNLNQLGVTLGAGVMPKAKVRTRGQRKISESDACVLVAVPAGFPLGFLRMFEKVASY